MHWQDGDRARGERAVPELQFPHGMRNATMAYASSASIDVAAYENRSGRRLLVARNLTTTTNDESYHGSAASCHLPPRTGTRSGTSPVCRTR
jgi:hypothetical protein